MSGMFLSNSFFSDEHLFAGINLFRGNMFREAVTEFDKALALSPDDPYSHWNKATALLSLGDYEEGFKEYSWGWRLFDWRGFGPLDNAGIERVSALPLWEGENLTGKKLLVYHEMGFGDGIMTMRYLPELKRRARHVTLVISSPLIRLAERFGIEVVDALPSDVSSYDYRLPFFGVMMALAQTTVNIPRAPYIDTEWCREKGKLGIAWSGRTQDMFTLDYFLSMLDHDDYELFSLQIGSVDCIDEVHPLNAADFADTVNVISKMEHIVTVDTAIAHLAGAMGHPSTHLLLPYLMDWRWWRSEVWYPTISPHRQEQANDWLKPFASVNQALRVAA